jgi:hypothetical protein
VTPRRRIVGLASVILAVAGLVGVCVTAAAGATGGCPAGNAGVTVSLPDGSTHQVSAQDICDNADVTDTQYFTRAAPNQPKTQEPFVQSGLSIHALLGLLGVDPSTVGFVALTRPDDGTLSTLTGDDLADPSDFADGLLPVVWINGDVVDYARPLTTDAHDVNARDVFPTAPGATLGLAVHNGSVLTVHADSDRLSVKPRTTVDFSGTVPNPPSAARPLRFDWSWGDGSAPGRGVITHHRFAKPGGYEVQLTVTGADDSEGVSPPILITVGKPGKSSHPTHSPSPSHSATQSQSPNPTHSSHHSNGTGQSTPPTTPPPTPLPGVSFANVPTTVPSIGASAFPTASPQPPELASAPPLISGVLVGDSQPLTPQQAASLASQPRPIATIGSTSSSDPWAWVAGCAGVFALLVLGAARELWSTSRWNSTPRDKAGPR